MRTHIVIVESLLRKAMPITRARSKREVVDIVLRAPKVRSIAWLRALLPRNNGSGLAKAAGSAVAAAGPY